MGAWAGSAPARSRRVHRLLGVLVLGLCLGQYSCEEPPEWNQYRSRMSNIMVDGSPAAGVERAMDWTYSIPLEYVRRGQSYVGANARLRRVMSDMVAGKPVEIAVLGGSISTGAVASRKQAAVDPNDVWSLVRIFIQGNVEESVAFYNNARSATKSYITSICLDKFLNSTADLVFVEFIANDGTEMDTTISSNEKSRSYERLLRKILKQPSAPAVVLMQMMPNEMAYPPEGLFGKSKRNFAATPEDSYNNLAQYYDVPALSFRNAVYQMGDNGRMGKSWADFMGPDRLHPNDLGHKVMADLVVYLLQQTIVSLSFNPVGAAEKSSQTSRLPPPMYLGNEIGSSIPICAMGPDMAELVVTNKSWTMVKTADKYATYGYETTKPNAPLTVEVNTVTPDKRQPGVSFTYIKAQKGYGGLQVSCDNGCTCADSYLDGTLTYDQVVLFMETINPTPAPRCHINFAMAANSTAGSKVRVSGVAVNGDPGSVSGRIGEEKYMAWLTGIDWAA